MALVLPDGEERLTINFRVGGQEDGSEETMAVILGPEEFSTVVGGFKWIKTTGLWGGEGKPDDMAALGLANFGLIERIKDWEGPVTPKGDKVPCNLENKMRFFGRYPQALSAIWEALNQRLQEQEGNSEPSPHG